MTRQAILAAADWAEQRYAADPTTGRDFGRGVAHALALVRLHANGLADCEDDCCEPAPPRPGQIVVSTDKRAVDPVAYDKAAAGIQIVSDDLTLTPAGVSRG